MVYLYYISRLRDTILVGNPRYYAMLGASTLILHALFSWPKCIFRIIFSRFPIVLHFYAKVCVSLHNGARTCCVHAWWRVEKRGGGVGGGVGRVLVDVSCVCVWANVCICHSRDRKKMFLTCKDKNKVLKVRLYVWSAAALSV